MWEKLPNRFIPVHIEIILILGIKKKFSTDKVPTLVTEWKIPELLQGIPGCENLNFQDHIVPKNQYSYLLSLSSMCYRSSVHILNWSLTCSKISESILVSVQVSRLSFDRSYHEINFPQFADYSPHDPRFRHPWNVRRSSRRTLHKNKHADIRRPCKHRLSGCFSSVMRKKPELSKK